MKQMVMGSLALICLSVSAQEKALVSEINKRNALNQLVYVPASTRESTDPAGQSVIRSTRSFYISQYEVTNKEYREFTNYVRDSIAHRLLGHFIKNSDRLDWKKKIDWEDKLLDPMRSHDGFRPVIDPSRLVYSVNGSEVQVYPDTLVWLADFSYSYNEPLVKRYFTHADYDLYPVVGISYMQAIAFCQWKTAGLKEGLAAKGNITRFDIALPDQSEWEAAADGGEQSFVNLLFVEGKYNLNMGRLVDSTGMLIIDYDDDGYYYTAPVTAFRPNGFGVYNMIGNVAEWVLPEVNVYPVHNSLAITKGGGWHSGPSTLSVAAREKRTTSDAHSFVGFRYVLRLEKH